MQIFLGLKECLGYVVFVGKYFGEQPLGRECNISNDLGDTL
jgi:hypothetical protein